MARRLIVDTNILITAERGEKGPASVVDDDDDLVIAAITLAELRTGVELAGEQHRATREAFVEQVLAALPVEPYDANSAQAHARLLAHVHRSGTPRGAHDLIVAATAVATGRTILTTDRGARFGDLPGVDAIVANAGI